MLTDTAAERAQRLNHDCDCNTLHAERLAAVLEGDSGQADFLPWLRETRPHLFASTPVFLPASTAQRIRNTVAAIEQAAALPAWQEWALSRAPAIARIGAGVSGVFMGYDFHLTDNGPRLIEINTNAGGALLNAVLARAHAFCCGEWPAKDPEREFLAMFREEWKAQRGDAPLRRIAIVDDAPEGQYLAPEFQLFRTLFRRAGYDSDIVDAAALRHRDGRLWHGETAIDLVYNRLTDFMLEQPAHAELRAAYEANAVVLTPTPRSHALLADKRNLAMLCDDAQLADWGLDADARAAIAATVLHAQEVTPANADALWAGRQHLFFKPFAGHAGKAAYRGDKLTRRVWESVREGGFIAQEVAPPAQRRVGDGYLKYDLRAYAWRGRVQLFAARLYQGQTTNFRTAGGGFAPVLVPPASLLD